MVSKWDKSVKRATKKALADGKIEHDEVIDIVRSALDGGGITKKERDNLEEIRNRSKTMPDRSKRLIDMLCSEYDYATISGVRSKQKIARVHRDKVCNFLKQVGKGSFSKLDRDVVGAGLVMRLSFPSLIDQNRSMLCGPSAFLYSLAKDKPRAYVDLAIDLFQKGRGKIGSLDISPGSDLRAYLPPAGKIHQVDWMMAASIRDSENAFFDYQAVGDDVSAITMPSALAGWLNKAGWNDIKNETNVYFTKAFSNLQDAVSRKKKGHRVCLFIASKLLSAKKKKNKGKSPTPNHWVVLTDVVSIAGDIHLKVYSWGEGKTNVGPLDRDTFLRNYYGYVSGNPKGT